jgi:hypothetical protein
VVKEILAYILGANSAIDKIECNVPEEVNDIIFFGPCKNKMRFGNYRLLDKWKSSQQVVGIVETEHTVAKVWLLSMILNNELIKGRASYHWNSRLVLIRFRSLQLSSVQ